MDELLTEIAEFTAKHRLTDKDFGVLALNDHHFLRDLRGEGSRPMPRSPSFRTVDRVRAFMAEYAAAPTQAAA